MAETPLPEKIKLSDGSQVKDFPRLKGLLQAVIAAQDGCVAANRQKQTSLKALEDAGYDKKTAQLLLNRRNKKQLELDISDERLHVYERAMGWRDPDMDHAAAAEAAKDDIDRAMDNLNESSINAIHHGTGILVACIKGAYPLNAADRVQYPVSKSGEATIYVLQLENQQWVAACDANFGPDRHWGTVLQPFTSFETREGAVDAAARDLSAFFQQAIADGGPKNMIALATKMVAWFGELFLKEQAEPIEEDEHDPDFDEVDEGEPEGDPDEKGDEAPDDPAPEGQRQQASDFETTF